MPQQFWKHQCPGKSPGWVGSPRACACGEPMVYDGWRNSGFEAMAWSQKFHGLKPIGPHRALRGLLFAGTRKPCGVCSGRGYFDAADGLAFEACSHCEGAGYCSTISVEQCAMLRAQVLAVFPTQPRGPTCRIPRSAPSSRISVAAR
jgi:hypothetical protein